ncbi:MAG: L-ribulose-5-phosphate 4-epimerase AraD [Candidatus Peregrinibacteria bacterium]
MLPRLRQEVAEANISLARLGLATLTWGNVSGIDRKRGLVVIKPSGVPYETLKAGNMVVVDLKGNVAEGRLTPSSDTPAHIELYREFPGIGGITHTHSTYATVFAQAQKEIPCLGTTHADHFHGTVPVTRLLTEAEVLHEYERNTGRVIVERMAGIDPLSMPAVLLAGHAPFCWGRSAADSVVNSLALERAAEMALGVLVLNPSAPPLPKYLLDKHYGRKHGALASYGQKKR